MHRDPVRTLRHSSPGRRADATCGRQSPAGYQRPSRLPIVLCRGGDDGCGRGAHPALQVGVLGSGLRSLRAFFRFFFFARLCLGSSDGGGAVRPRQRRPKKGRPRWLAGRHATDTAAPQVPTHERRRVPTQLPEGLGARRRCVRARCWRVVESSAGWRGVASRLPSKIDLWNGHTIVHLSGPIQWSWTPNASDQGELNRHPFAPVRKTSPNMQKTMYFVNLVRKKSQGKKK